MKIRTKVTHFVDYSDLETFIQDTYSLPSRYEILESPNDVDYTHDVDGKLSYGEEEARKHVAKGHAEYYYIGELLNLLCMDKKIEKGTYVVQVSW